MSGLPPWASVRCKEDTSSWTSCSLTIIHPEAPVFSGCATSNNYYKHTRSREVATAQLWSASVPLNINISNARSEKKLCSESDKYFPIASFRQASLPMWNSYLAIMND